MTIALEFHERLAKERDRLGLTYADLADATGVPEETLSQYEQGAVPPQTAFLIHLPRLGFDVHYVMFAQSAADFASDSLDWELLGHIAWETEVAARRNCLSIVNPEKYGQALKLFYEFTRSDSDSPASEDGQS